VFTSYKNLTRNEKGDIMEVIELFWQRVDNLEKQIEKTSDVLWKAMWKEKLVDLMKNIPDKRMIN
tara:strand:- start:431 stop:625 length:195 start_codon:yes stop_codon:yes gene_type:complete